MNGSIVIRDVVLSDAGALIKMIPAIDQETPYMKRNAGEFAMSEDEEKEIIKGIISDPLRVMLIAEYDGTIAGSLGISQGVFKKYAHTATFGMGILEEFWGFGIGSQLIDRAITWAESRNIERVCLEVASANERAIHLYKKKGFILEGILKNHIKIGEDYFDILMMAKNIR